MPKCQQCQRVFPCRIVIDNKIHNLQSRKRCLECSPFGEHNTHKLGIMVGQVKICKICRKDFVYNRTNGSRLEICASCRTSERRRKVKIKALIYLGNKCIHCGFDKHIAALQFHHRDPGTKENIVGLLYSSSWERIVKELNKCEILCANCHAIEHNS